MSLNYGLQINPGAIPGFSGGPEVRTTTDLESIQQNLQGAVSFSSEINEHLAQLVTKLRGSLPPSADNGPKANLSEVPAGIIGELRDMHRTLHERQSLTVELISTLRTSI